MKSKPSFMPLDWVLFFAFLGTNSLLAFGPFSLIPKIWIGLIGLVVPFLLAFSGKPSSVKGQPLFEKENFLPRSSPWLWLSFIGLGLFLRFYRLTTLSTWPFLDESSFSGIAIRLSQNWDGRFFYCHSQNAFPYFWALALWFKALGPSLQATWLFPSVVSALAIPLAYLAARQYFSKGLSFLLTAFAACAFWNLFAGRVAMFTALVPLAELLALYAFGRFLNSPFRNRNLLALLWALTVGMGFYIYPLAWLPLALLLVFSMAALAIRNPKDYRRASAWFFPALALTLVPLAYGVVKQSYGSYLRSLALAPSAFNPHQLLVSLSYVTGLFWGKTEGDFYGPYWGGFLDPVSGALLFIGFIQCVRARKEPMAQWIVAAFALSLLPGILSANLEFFRIYFIFPFLLVLAALGLQKLVSSISPKYKVLTAALLLLTITALNTYHFLKPYRDYWKTPAPRWNNYKSVENYRAFQILEKVFEAQGPGLIFQNFQPDMFDQSLMLATFPFNTALNPKLSSAKPQWFSLVTNVNYRPFLSRRFPGGKWINLSQDMDRPDGGLALALFPTQAADPALLQSWTAANRIFQEEAYSYLNRPTGTSYDGVIRELQTDHFLVQGDPFLESCFWEKIYYLYLQNRMFGDKKWSANLKPCLETIQLAVHYGYPAAHLLNELGTYFTMMKKFPEAEKAFRAALKANPNFATAAGNLRYILQLKAETGSKPRSQ